MRLSGIDILLHDHLDGSYPLLSILPELWRKTHEDGREYPAAEHRWEDHHGWVKRWFNDAHRNIVEKFSLTTEVMQDVDTLFLAGKTYTEMRARQGFRYCEARIAPQYHTKLGLTEKQVMDALIRGIKRGELNYPGIEVNLILSIGREVSPDRACDLTGVTAECDRAYVPGIDLVCYEPSDPPEKFKKAYILAKLFRLKTTCHAGEWVTDTKNFLEDIPLLLKNIRMAVFELNVNRIGHATALAYDPKLISHIVARGIGIEGCPGSNLLTGAIPHVSLLKIRELLNAGVLYSMSPDDDLFLPDMDETFLICNDFYKFTNEEKAKLRLNAWKTRFGNRKPIPEDIVL